MRCRYCSTRCRDEVRPSCMAFCISGTVASTTEKGAAEAGADGAVLVLHAASAAARTSSPARDDFMAGILGQNENICVYFTTRPRPAGWLMSVNCDSL